MSRCLRSPRRWRAGAGLGSLAELRAACRSGAAAVSRRTAGAAQPRDAAGQRAPPREPGRAADTGVHRAGTAGQPVPGRELRSVFASDEGTGEVCQQMLEALATTRAGLAAAVSRTRCTTRPRATSRLPGATASRPPSRAWAFESFASGLLCAVSEAAATGQPVLLVAYDPRDDRADRRAAAASPSPPRRAWILELPERAHGRAGRWARSRCELEPAERRRLRRRLPLAAAALGREQQCTRAGGAGPAGRRGPTRACRCAGRAAAQPAAYRWRHRMMLDRAASQRASRTRARCACSMRVTAMGRDAHRLRGAAAPHAAHPLARDGARARGRGHRICGAGDGRARRVARAAGRAARRDAGQAAATSSCTPLHLDDSAARWTCAPSCSAARRAGCLYAFEVGRRAQPVASGRLHGGLRATPDDDDTSIHRPKRALVTGGSGAIGAAICRALAADGCTSSCTPTAASSARRRWPRASRRRRPAPRRSPSTSPTTRRCRPRIEALLARARSRFWSTTPAFTRCADGRHGRGRVARASSTPS